MNERVIEQKSTYDESSRIVDLERYAIVGTPAEKEFDDVATVAAYIAGTPMAYISFVDETQLWFKATHGFDATSVKREDTYCQYVVRDARPLAIPDTYYEKVNVPKQRKGLGERIRFYVGVPLRSRSGFVLGTLCVVDTSPHDVPDDLVAMLERLAAQVTAQLEVRRINRALIEERDTFSTLFEAAPAPLILSERGLIVRCNIAFADLVSDKEAEARVGVSLGDFIAVVPHKPGEVIETELTNEVGGVTPVLVLTTRLRREQRLYDLVAVTDISDRKEKERILKEQQTAAENANRIKDTFLSLVSHDLRSPLSGISTMLELLDRAGSTFTPEEWKSAIKDLREAAAVLVEMINQLLNIHRIQSGRIEINREDVPVAMVARQVTLSLSKQISDKEVSIQIDVPDEFEINADFGLFREALFNLVSNAIKFSDHGGTIRVSGDSSRVVVEDEGTGVPEKDRPDLFKHEVKTSRLGTDGERGTGLGLPLTWDIMDAHGGRVFYDEDYMTGARFVLDFSATSDPESSE